MISSPAASAVPDTRWGSGFFGESIGTRAAADTKDGMIDNLIGRHFIRQYLRHVLIRQPVIQPLQFKFPGQKERHTVGIGAAVVDLAHRLIACAGDQREHAPHLPRLRIGGYFGVVMEQPQENKNIPLSPLITI